MERQRGTVQSRERRLLIVGGVIMGAGLGGFLDGIVLHQILQWHNMISWRLPPVTMEAMRANMRWDGAFHLGVWLLTAAGIAILWRAAVTGALEVATFSGINLVGAMVAGWGLFNLVEGTVNHQILGLHRVNEHAPRILAWDIAFLAFGAILLVLGWMLGRRGGAVHARVA